MTEVEEYWVGRLRHALHDSEERPRPIAPLKLPHSLSRLLGANRLLGLKPAAVLVPVVVDQGRHGLLFTRRAAHLRRHGGQISFPGGAREPGDSSARIAALREAREEVGLPTDRVEVIGYLDDYPTITGFRITPVVGLVAEPFSPQLATEEVESTFAVPLSYALDPANYRWRTLRRAGIPVPYVELRYGAHRIWGATAGMLWNLLEKLNSVA